MRYAAGLSACVFSRMCVWTTRTTHDVQGFLPCLQTRGGSSDWDRSGVVMPCRQHCRVVCVRPHKRVQTSQNMKCKRDPAGSSIGGPTRWRRTLVAGIRRGPIGFYRCSCEEQATVQHCTSCFVFKRWQVWDFQFRQTEKNTINQNHFVKRKMYQVENEWFILLKISDLLIYWKKNQSIRATYLYWRSNPWPSCCCELTVQFQRHFIKMMAHFCASRFIIMGPLGSPGTTFIE